MMGMRYQIDDEQDIKFSGKLADVATYFGFVPFRESDVNGRYVITVDYVELTKSQVAVIANFMEDWAADLEDIDWYKLNVLKSWLEKATEDSVMLFI